ncbi:MAG: DUF4440 domain-containing protein [Acidobacteriia bacterium]|nr:DUF4440 domain-containing protein [Terriglobia bacterium]
MRRFLSIGFLFSVAVLSQVNGFLAGAPAPPGRSPQDEIRHVLDTQVAAWNQGDIEGFMKGYWNSQELLFTSGGKLRRGWQETLNQYKATYPDHARMGELSFSDLEVHLLPNSRGQGDTPVAAWVLGKWRLKRAGDEPQGIFTLILQKFPNSQGGVTPVWKIVHDHTSSSLPEPK